MLFRRTLPQLAARYNKWQIRHMRKTRLKSELAQERKKKQRHTNNPSPTARWMYSPTWKKLVQQEKIREAEFVQKLEKTGKVETMQ